MVKTGGSLSCCDHALLKIVISKNMGLVKSIVRSLNFRSPNFGLFKELLDKIPWETVLRDKGTEHRRGMREIRRDSIRTLNIRDKQRKCIPSDK